MAMHFYLLSITYLCFHIVKYCDYIMNLINKQVVDNV